MRPLPSTRPGWALPLFLVGLAGLVASGCGAGTSTPKATSPSSTSPEVEAAPGAATLPRIVACGGSRVLRPSSFVISCADANTALTKIDWRSWGPRGATATATYMFNDCTPTCVAGHDHADPATVTLSDPEHTAHGVEFATLKVTYATSATASKRFSFALITS